MAKKLSRRDFLRLSALGAGGAALAACAAEPTAAPTAVPEVEAPVKEEETTVSFAGSKLSMKLRSSFIPQVNEILKAEVLDWGKQNDVEVEVDIVSMNDLQTIAATAAETGAGPDIIELNQASAHLFAEALADVSDVAEDLGNRYGGWYDSAMEACKVGDAWLALPRYYAAHAINYRTDIFEAAGITKLPTTYDELYEVGKTLMDAGLAPIAFPLGHAVGDGNDWNYSVLWSFGGSDVAEDGKTVTINSDGTRAALEYMQKLFSVMPPDTLSYDDGSNNRAFNAGDISTTNNAASIYINARNQGIKVMVGDEEKNLFEIMDHFAYPAGPAGTVTYAEFMSQAVFKYSQNVPAAKALLMYLNEKDQLSPYAMPANSFVFPALKVYKDMAIMPWNSNPVLTAFKVYAEQSHLPGYPSTNFRGGTEAYAKWIVVDMFAAVCGGAATIDEAIASAEEQLKAIYEA